VKNKFGPKNQSAVKVQFCSEKVPVFRSRLERDSNVIRKRDFNFKEIIIGVFFIVAILLITVIFIVLFGNIAICTDQTYTVGVLFGRQTIQKKLQKNG
jgi:hypothetical protein